MTDAIVWADKLPDIIKKWMLVIPMILAVFGSGTGLYQYFEKNAVAEKAEVDKNKAVHEVAIGFQSAMSASPVISSCGGCSKRIKKLERWHNE